MESKRDCPPPVLNVNNEYNCVTLYTIAMGKVHFELSSNISKTTSARATLNIKVIS